MAGSRSSSLKYRADDFQPNLTKTFQSLAGLSPAVLLLKDALESNSKVVSVVNRSSRSRIRSTQSSFAALPAAVRQSSDFQNLSRGADKLSSISQDPSLNVGTRSAASNQLTRIDRKMGQLINLTVKGNTDTLADMEKLFGLESKTGDLLDGLTGKVIQSQKQSDKNTTALIRSQDKDSDALARQLIGGLENPNVYMNQELHGMSKTLLITNELLKDLRDEAEKQTKFEKTIAKNSANGGSGGGGGIGGALAGALGGMFGGKVLGKIAGSKLGRAGIKLASKIPGMKTVGKAVLKQIPGGEAFLKNSTGIAAEGAEAASKNAAKTAGKELTEGAVKEAASGSAKAATKATEKLGAEAVGKTAGKTLLKKVPLVGAAVGAGLAADRASDGDMVGAGLELASGIASIIPVIGTAASLGIDGYLAARDLGFVEKDSDKDESKDDENKLKDQTQVNVVVPQGVMSAQAQTLSAISSGTARPTSATPDAPVGIFPMTKGGAPAAAPGGMKNPSPMNMPGGPAPSRSKYKGEYSQAINSKGLAKGNWTDAELKSIEEARASGEKFRGGVGLTQSTKDKITATAEKYGIPPENLMAMAQMESGGNTNAVSTTGAAGIFQFTGGTAQTYGIKNRFDEDENIDAGARLYRDNYNTMKKGLGREPTADEVYLAHQQGAGSIKNKNGALGIIRAAETGGDVSAATKQNMSVNVGAGNNAAGFIAANKKHLASAAAKAQVTLKDDTYANINKNNPKEGLADKAEDKVRAGLDAMGIPKIGGGQYTDKEDLSKVDLAPLSNEIVVDPKYTPKGWKGADFQVGRGVPESEAVNLVTSDQKMKYGGMHWTPQGQLVKPGLTPQAPQVAATPSLNPATPTATSSATVGQTSNNLTVPTTAQTSASTGVAPIANLSKLEVGSKVGTNPANNARGNQAAAGNQLSSNRGTPSKGLKGSESPTHIDDLGIVLINTGML